VVAVIDDADVELLRSLARRLLEAGAPEVILGGRQAEALDVIVARAEGSTFDCGGFLKRIAALAGGRGGGRPVHAEGRLPPSTDFAALVGGALDAV
jgi:alanyl-tRNA synthetase